MRCLHIIFIMNTGTLHGAILVWSCKSVVSRQSAKIGGNGLSNCFVCHKNGNKKLNCNSPVLAVNMFHHAWLWHYILATRITCCDLPWCLKSALYPHKVIAVNIHAVFKTVQIFWNLYIRYPEYNTKYESLWFLWKPIKPS